METTEIIARALCEINNRLADANAIAIINNSDRLFSTLTRQEALEAAKNDCEREQLDFDTLKREG